MFEYVTGALRSSVGEDRLPRTARRTRHRRSGACAVRCRPLPADQRGAARPSGRRVFGPAGRARSTRRAQGHLDGARTGDGVARAAGLHHRRICGRAPARAPSMAARGIHRLDRRHHVRRATQRSRRRRRCRRYHRDRPVSGAGRGLGGRSIAPTGPASRDSVPLLRMSGSRRPSWRGSPRRTGATGRRSDCESSATRATRSTCLPPPPEDAMRRFARSGWNSPPAPAAWSTSAGQRRRGRRRRLCRDGLGATDVRTPPCVASAVRTPERKRSW